MTDDRHDTLADELIRQDEVLRREMPERVVLTALAFALCTIWAPPVLVLALWLAHGLAEALLTLGGGRDGWLRRSAGGYRATLILTALVEVLHVTSAGLVWMSDDPYAKAFAVGMIMSTLMHLTAVRSIHLPCGIAGLSGVAAAALAVNSTYWLDRHDPVGLCLSTAGAFGALAYTMTAMLSNNRLHRSTAQGTAAARAADEAKGLFLAQMSHELRTPLNAIIGMGQAELAALRAPSGADPAAGPPEDRAQRLRMLVDQARTLALILDDVTDIEAINTGRLQQRLRVVNLGDELSAIGASFRERARRLGVPFTSETRGPLPGYVRIDPVRLRQCLGNLLTNALRHAQGAPVQAICSTVADPDGTGTGGLLTVEVRDTGPGIPEDQRDTIFQPFRKGRAAAPGSGLGLAIARALARNMGGDLELLPSARGATFRLRLRFDLASAPAAQADPPDLSCRQILVVDDVASNRLVAASYLRALGARVIIASSGQEALDILATEDLDLVLLDMNMPGLDGFETAARARGMGGKAAAVPIVAMTADVMPDQVAAIRQAGLDGHLPKPILPETLAAELARLL